MLSTLTFLSVTCKISPRVVFAFNFVYGIFMHRIFFLCRYTCQSFPFCCFYTLKVLPHLQIIQLLTLFSPSFHSCIFYT